MDANKRSVSVAITSVLGQRQVNEEPVLNLEPPSVFERVSQSVSELVSIQSVNACMNDNLTDGENDWKTRILNDSMVDQMKKNSMGKNDDD